MKEIVLPAAAAVFALTGLTASTVPEAHRPSKAIVLKDINCTAGGNPGTASQHLTPSGKMTVRCQVNGST